MLTVLVSLRRVLCARDISRSGFILCACTICHYRNSIRKKKVPVSPGQNCFEGSDARAVMLDILVWNHSLVQLHVFGISRGMQCSCYQLFQHCTLCSILVLYQEKVVRMQRQCWSSSQAIESPLQRKGFYSMASTCSYSVSGQSIIDPKMCSALSAFLLIPYNYTFTCVVYLLSVLFCL